MNKFFATLCIVGTALALSACETSNTTTYASSASYAKERTAGNINAAPAKVKQERVFSRAQVTK